MPLSLGSSLTPASTPGPQVNVPLVIVPRLMLPLGATTVLPVEPPSMGGEGRPPCASASSCVRALTRAAAGSAHTRPDSIQAPGCGARNPAPPVGGSREPPQQPPLWEAPCRTTGRPSTARGRQLAITARSPPSYLGEAQGTVTAPLADASGRVGWTTGEAHGLSAGNCGPEGLRGAYASPPLPGAIPPGSPQHAVPDRFCDAVPW